MIKIDNNNKLITFPEKSTRIDYIFANKEQSVNYNIVFTDEMVSDHYGVFVELNK